MFKSKPLKIYLDQKDWINLARAYYNRSDGEAYKPVLNRILDLAESNKAIFPLSTTHIIETNKRRDYDSKKRLAVVMAEISRGNTIANQTDMAISELNIALAQKYSNKTSNTSTASTSAFGIGFPFAFGMNYHLVDKNNKPVKISDDHNQFIQNTLTDKNLLVQMLVGNDEKTSTYLKWMEENRRKHIKAAEEFRKRVRAYDKRILKRAYSANLIVELYADVAKILKKYGQTIEDFLKIGADQLELFFGMIPTLDTEIELATRRNEHWNKKIDKNDVSDIRSLSVAIPYCDIVVTEVFWANVAQFTGLSKKYNTQVTSSLDKLLPFLD